ncbi:MAG: DUF58 domain-containing protein [Planctomycetota bacterium]
MSDGKLLDDEFVSRIERLELVSRKIISGKLKGERKSKRRGYSTEFADFRPYTAGDDLRFLDWNIYGRLDRLFLRVFLEEEDLWFNALLDSSPSMAYGDPQKFLYAKRIVAALSYIGLVNQDRVRIGTFSSKLKQLFGPARGRRQAHKLLEVMEGLEVDKETTTDLGKSCRDFALGSARSGIVILVTDFFDRAGFEQALRSLVATGSATEIFVFHVMSPEEIDPQVTGDLRLVDAEDAFTAEVTVSKPLLKAYKKNLDIFRAEIQQYCSRVGMHYVFTSTAVPFDQLVLNYLRRRGLVR